MMRPLSAFALFGILAAATAFSAPHAEGGYVASLARNGEASPSLPLLKMAADEDPNALTQLFISPCGEPFRAKTSDPYPVVVWFNRADTNHDAQLDRTEFVADAMQFFQKLDANGDGMIDSRELYYYEHITVPEIMAGQQQTSALTSGLMAPRFLRVADFERVQMGGMGGGGGGGLGGINGPPVVNGDDQPPPSHPDNSDPNSLVGAAPYNLLGEPEPVAASDLSFSGKISQADFKTRANQRFDVLDSDQRGYLTLNSLPKTVAQTLVKPRRPGKRRGSKSEN